MLAKEVPRQLQQFNGQDVANIIWAAATLKEQALLDVVPFLQTVLPGLAPQFNEQHVSNIIWAVATLKDIFPELLTSLPIIAKQVPRVAFGVIPQEISNILWATAHIGEEAPAELLEALPSLLKLLMSFGLLLRCKIRMLAFWNCFHICPCLKEASQNS